MRIFPTDALYSRTWYYIAVHGYKEAAEFTIHVAAPTEQPVSLTGEGGALLVYFNMWPHPYQLRSHPVSYTHLTLPTNREV